MYVCMYECKIIIFEIVRTLKVVGLFFSSQTHYVMHNIMDLCIT